MLDDVHKELLTAIGKAHENLKRELGKLRAGRANANLLDGIRVDYYGTMTQLSKMANISVPEPRLITVKPWDKSQIKAVEKALRESELNLNPQPDGDIIRIPLPPLTEERRKEFVKVVRARAEDGRTAVRGARRDARKDLDALEKDGDISADDLRRAEGDLDKLTKRFEAEIDEALDAKTVELLEG